MNKTRGAPDRRGMGAQSDFIGETFVPSRNYEIQRLEMLRALRGIDLSTVQLEKALPSYGDRDSSVLHLDATPPNEDD